MLGLEKEKNERILCSLEEMGYPFPQFKLYKVNHQFQMIGSGGFSIVYEMTDTEHADRHYAMKVMGFERNVMDSEAFWNTFRIQRVLCEESPYIMRIFMARELEVEIDASGQIKQVRDAEGERWTSEGVIFQFVLMERLEGVVWKDKFGNVMPRSLSLTTEEEVVNFAMQIGQAVMLAHENHVLHRDIKLENIFWDREKQNYKLGDFGIAKYVQNGNAETVVYTDGYGAPEIERRLDNYYNATADIYSFGITLYLLLNNLRFPGSEGYYVNIVQYDPEFIFPAPLHASEGMTRLIRKMCCYRKEDRYQTMSEVLHDLKQLCEKEETDEENIDFSDYETETYREEKRTQTDVKTDIDQLIAEYNEKKKTRAGRRLLEQEQEEEYAASSRRYFIVFSILFLLLLKGLQKDSFFIGHWQFWILPIAVFLEGILQKIGEFHVAFGLLTVGIGIYSILTVGITVPHIFLLASMIFNVPVLTTAGATGTGLWMLLEHSGKMTWVSFIAGQSWILFIVFFLTLYGVLKLCIEYGKTTYFSALIGFFLYDKLAIGMVIAGIVLWIMQRSGRIVIPEVIQRIHLIRTGVISCIIYFLTDLWDDWDLPEGESDEGETIEHEYLDK